MKFKKLICIVLSMAMIGSAAGCGSTGAATSQAADEAAGTGDSVSATSGVENTDVTATPEVANKVEEIAADDISVTWEDSHVYTELTLGRYYPITTYGVKGYEEVPFISASDYLDILCEGKQRTSVEDGVMKITVNGSEAVIDPFADTIVIEQPSRFRSIGGINGAIIEDKEFNVVTVSTKNKSTETGDTPLKVSLKDYNMPVIAYEDDILMPFLALQNTFGSIRQNNVLAYNGKDYYNAYNANYHLLTHSGTTVMDAPYTKALYHGPFSEKAVMSKAYAEYGYYSICLLLDLTFGHKEEKGITTFDEYFTRMNAKESMCSTDPSSAMIAEFMLFNYLFDSGHDSVLSTDNVFGEAAENDQAKVDDIVDEIKESEEGKELFDEAGEPAPGFEDMEIDAILGALLEKGFNIPEVAPLLAWTFYFNSIKPKDYGDQRLDYSDDTAVIYFNAFKDDSTTRSPSYYLDPITDKDVENNTYAFFYRCFEDIRKHKDVKNVVINISDNGGGSACALVSVLGFLSEDGEVKITVNDLGSGNYREECYHVDTNLDGVADDQDGYGGQYDFYIMCSGSSYSCGNALPYYAQKDGLAKIIGTNPGGGDCVVGSFVDAFGRCAAYSSMLKLGQFEGSEFVSDEKAVTVDLNMMPSFLDIQYAPWYDPKGIADAVHQYQSGATELTYGDISDEEKLSEFLLKLFEKVMATYGTPEDSGTADTAEIAGFASGVEDTDIEGAEIIEDAGAEGAEVIEDAGAEGTDTAQ